MRVTIPALAGLLLAGQAELASAQSAAGPCGQIRAICEQAGFVTGGVRTGMGLMGDCIRPIMQGGHQPRRAAQPLPAVDPQIVAACKARNPSFGMARKSKPGAEPPAANPDEGQPPADAGEGQPPPEQPAAPPK